MRVNKEEPKHFSDGYITTDEGLYEVIYSEPFDSLNNSVKTGSNTNSIPEDINALYAVVDKSAKKPKETVVKKEPDSSVGRNVKQTKILTNGSLNSSHIKYSIENIEFSVSVETVDRMYKTTNNRSRTITKCVQFKEPSKNDDTDEETNLRSETKKQHRETELNKIIDYDSINEGSFLEECEDQFETAVRTMNRRLANYDSFNRKQILKHPLSTIDQDKNEPNVC